MTKEFERYPMIELFLTFQLYKERKNVRINFSVFLLYLLVPVSLGPDF
jgi:hypothetical protein